MSLFQVSQGTQSLFLVVVVLDGLPSFQSVVNEETEGISVSRSKAGLHVTLDIVPSCLAVAENLCQVPLERFPFNVFAEVTDPIAVSP